MSSSSKAASFTCVQPYSSQTRTFRHANTLVVHNTERLESSKTELSSEGSVCNAFSYIIHPTSIPLTPGVREEPVCSAHKRRFRHAQARGVHQHALQLAPLLLAVLRFALALLLQTLLPGDFAPKEKVAIGGGVGAEKIAWLVALTARAVSKVCGWLDGDAAHEFAAGWFQG